MESSKWVANELTVLRVFVVVLAMSSLGFLFGYEIRQTEIDQARAAQSVAESLATEAESEAQMWKSSYDAAAVNVREHDQSSPNWKPSASNTWTALDEQIPGFQGPVLRWIIPGKVFPIIVGNNGGVSFYVHNAGDGPPVPMQGPFFPTVLTGAVF